MPEFSRYEVTLLMLTFALLGSAWAEVPHPTGRIDTVVVYPDRAAVTRVLSVDLVPGTNHISFEDLPPTVDERTIQAEGNGVEGAQLLGLDVVTRELIEDRRVRVAQLESDIEALDDAIRVDNDTMQAAQTELRFLTSLQSAAAAQVTSELFFADQTAVQAGDIAKLLKVQVPDVQTRIRVAEFAARDKKFQRDALQRELDTTRGASQWARRDVSVDIESPKAGTAEVRLTYVLPGAGWSPAYDARALPDDKKVSLVMNAQITQTSGEDWSGVQLSLSTARPAEGTSPPVLDPFYLLPPQPVYSYNYTESYDRDDSAGLEEESSTEYKKEKAYSDAPSLAPPPPPPPMLIAVATVTEREVATTFEVPGRVAVPGDGTRRKLRVFEQALDVNFVHVAVPRFDTNAYLVGGGTWNASYPLLAGEVASFLGDSFVGTSQIGRIGTGEDYEFSFGVDEAVEVLSTPFDTLTSNPDWLGKVTVTRNWKFTVTNHRKNAVTVELRDRLPQASVEKYKVKIVGDVPDEKSPDGLIEFHRELAPNATAEASFGYVIRYPRKSPPGAVE